MNKKYPVLTTSPNNAFAHGMLTEVFPNLINGLQGSGLIASSHVEKLLALRDSITELDAVPVISGVGMTPERAWQQVRSFVGKPWVGLPSYASESLFYHLLLEAIGTFDLNSPYFAFDPFEPQKTADLARGLPTLDAAGRDLPRLQDHLMASLWGNLSDSAHQTFAAGRGMPSEEKILLVDQSAEAVATIESASRIAIVADNAGSELLADLMLAHRILQLKDDCQVTVYLKQRPYFVSDATLNDFQILATLLSVRSEFINELPHHLRERRLLPKTHWFFHSPLHYDDCPTDLLDEFGDFDVLIFKGDLHYRRLLADRVTPSDVELSTLLPRFASKVVILRTLKSDICAGVPADITSELESIDSRWRYSGKYAVIHCLPVEI